MAKVKRRAGWGLLILIVIFGVNYTLGNEIFNALWQIGVVLFDGAYRLLGAIMSKLATLNFH